MFKGLTREPYFRIISVLYKSIVPSIEYHYYQIWVGKLTVRNENDMKDGYPVQTKWKIGDARNFVEHKYFL